MSTSVHTYDPYKHCELCPRKCGVDRTVNTGFCGMGDRIRAARAALHMWEEPCISGSKGSGTVFFSGCNLGCVYCQNLVISKERVGKEITTDRLVEIYFELEEKGANNINLVTGDIYIPTIRESIITAHRCGFKIPFLLNTSSYINEDTLKSLDGLIDIYLADMKYIRDEDAKRFSNAPGYVDACKTAIGEMVKQQPECIYEQVGGEPDPIMKKGVIVRHLLLPGMLIQAKMILHYLHEKYGNDICVSLLGQYTPNGKLTDHPEIDRKVSEREYRSLVEYAASIGITHGYMQSGESADMCFLPDFNGEGI